MANENADIDEAMPFAPSHNTREEKLAYINTNFSQKSHYVNGGVEAIMSDIMEASNGRTRKVADFTDDEVQALFDIVFAR